VNKFGIGQPVRRIEDQRFITGRGHFVDDIDLPRQCYGAVIYSLHAHARILRIDTTEALAGDGVLCVLTGADAAAEGFGGMPPLFMPDDAGGPKCYRTRRPILVADVVRCVSDRVAFVVAETLEQARDAAERIVIDYEVLPAAIGIEESVASDAPQVWPGCPGNISFALAFGNKEATDAAFAKAAHTVSLKIDNNRIASNAIEPRCAIGVYEPGGDSYTLTCTTQNPHGTRQMVAQSIFNIPETKIRVISPDVGGGFGPKGACYPEDALVLWAARVSGRPVKWTATRSEAILGELHGRNQIVTVEIAVDGDGKILGLRSNGLHGIGAYTAAACAAPVVFATRLLPSVYQVPAIHLVNKAVFSHTTPVGTYRGAGRPEAIMAIERLLDEAAAKVGIDAAEIRRRNLITAQQMPYQTRTGYAYDSGDFPRILDVAMDKADWNGFAKRRAESKRRGRLRGRGIGYLIEEAAVFNERMELRFDPGGTVTIVAGTHSHGQGHATTFAQMVSDWLGVPFDKIRHVQGDTDAVPFGRGTYAARSAVLGGNALRMAADAVIDKAKQMAAHLMEASPADIEFEDGAFKIAGTDRAIPLTEVAKAFYRPMMLPPQFGVGLEGAGSWSASPASFPNGCQVCEVEVDPETGAIEIVRYTAVDDVGRVLNPLLCEGQITGGIVQGIGQALKEKIVFDDAGQLLSGTFQDYAMPRAADLPDIHSEMIEVLATTNPIGVKGAGEAGATGAPAAVMNAVMDALREIGANDIDMPATSQRVWTSIQRATKVVHA
jgi:aerobic carbon-monoxide dehydrogenase large subunit